jgi:hypothetical protein
MSSTKNEKINMLFLLSSLIITGLGGTIYGVNLERDRNTRIKNEILKSKKMFQNGKLVYPSYPIKQVEIYLVPDSLILKLGG